MSDNYKEFFEASHVVNADNTLQKKKVDQFFESINKLNQSLDCISSRLFEDQCADELQQIIITITLTFAIFIISKALFRLLKHKFAKKFDNWRNITATNPNDYSTRSLMTSLPQQPYNHSDVVNELAPRLPHCFVRSEETNAVNRPSSPTLSSNTIRLIPRTSQSMQSLSPQSHRSRTHIATYQPITEQVLIV